MQVHSFTAPLVYSLGRRAGDKLLHTSIQEVQHWAAGRFCVGRVPELAGCICGMRPHSQAPKTRLFSLLHRIASRNASRQDASPMPEEVIR